KECVLTLDTASVRVFMGDSASQGEDFVISKVSLTKPDLCITQMIIALKQNMYGDYETHLEPTIHFDCTIPIVGNMIGYKNANDGAGPILRSVEYESDPCNPEAKKPSLLMEFSEAIDLGQRMDVVKNITNGNMDDYFILWQNNEDSTASYMGKGRLFDTQHGDFEAFFISQNQLWLSISKEVTVPLTHFNNNVHDGLLSLSLVPDTSKDFKIMDSLRNGPNNPNRQIIIRTKGGSLNIICDVKHYMNPSGINSRIPTRLFQIQLNNNALVTAQGASGAEKPYFEVSMKIYDLLGNLVWFHTKDTKAKAIVSNELFMSLNFGWDYKNMKGRYVSSGGYLGIITASVKPTGSRSTYPVLKIVVNN
ncbi:MAG: hypothetical protein AB1633_11210, partial [Elusimicrobiota bacterium]